MKHLRLSLQTIGAALLLVLAIGCATTASQSTTDMLVAAGFRRVAADTPQRLTLLQSLPAGQISLITWKGKQFYVQPDVPNSQALVGTPTEYQAYQQIRIAKQMSNDNLMAAQMNQAAMDPWGSAWGPSFYGGFYGRGWR